MVPSDRVYCFYILGVDACEVTELVYRQQAAFGVAVGGFTDKGVQRVSFWQCADAQECAEEKLAKQKVNRQDIHMHGYLEHHQPLYLYSDFQN